MWFIIKYILISILTIIILHYLIRYLKDTFTIKKIKHTSSEIEKYKQVLHEIQESAIHTPTSLNPPPLTTTDFFSENTKSELMNDLDNFLSTQSEERIDTLTKYNTQNNINITFESI